VKPVLRVYGLVRGLAPEAARELATRLPFEHASPKGEVLDIEHEGVFVDVEQGAETIAQALPPGGSASLDVIDHEAWTVTRYRIAPGRVTARAFGVDDVLDPVRTD
jgi:hypothetical protein